ncbi:hypothetical protein ACFOSC_15335 [Streptantibioticus rubrisoli]|uniref:DUF1949 domain-containing protein n=1 Tax=Streptantibioticus rubrisoli TaxID=1387313 RepID=A0ABT1PB24_9ACTN|nr:hypothetical protein [Streptantibioticus rubrisoli]MCQ4041986.1 hypothetical protein [Streptantibioticus rubrisoli]
MCRADEPGFEGDGFDVDEVLWVPGVDYVAGWRAAADAAGALGKALGSLGLAVDDVKAQAHAAADGSGVVRLRLPVAVARELTEAIRAVAGGDEGRAAS